MHTILEHQRRTHETVDRLENLAASLLLDLPRTYRERLAQHHRVANFAAKVVQLNQTLLTTYQDVNKARLNDLNAMSGDNALSDFYCRLSKINDYHQRNINNDDELVPMELEFINPDSQPNDTSTVLDPLFSGEEYYGRFVDLHELHDTFINLQSKSTMPKTNVNHHDMSALLNSVSSSTESNQFNKSTNQAHRLTYLQYLDSLSNFKLIPIPKKQSAYFQYIQKLSTYLENFIERAHPLFDLNNLNERIRTEFELKWTSKQSFNEWHHYLDASSALFCDVCKKQYTTQSIFDHHLLEKRHKKALAVICINQDEVCSQKVTKRAEFESTLKSIAKTEFYIEKVINDYLSPVIRATKEYIERKQTLTEVELGQELESMDQLGRQAGDSINETTFKECEGTVGGGIISEDEEDENDEEEKIYNPLKLPLGWDGKPIPYWLYKLHGLGVEYSCEICGGYVYMGRKAFERHFQEFRHTIGMKSLGIPNNKQFQEITQIEDAVALWEKIQMTKVKIQFRPEEAEFEDGEGNVMSQKVYQDLQRQGLL